jgi:hypothetical protein
MFRYRGQTAPSELVDLFEAKMGCMGEQEQDS